MTVKSVQLKIKNTDIELTSEEIIQLKKEVDSLYYASVNDEKNLILYESPSNQIFETNTTLKKEGPSE